ncbi:MAG: oligosaccharide flippase family protein, partial [Bacteroidales bacterium]|nr:oligosaccharide flippase family protein [Candidatus Equimonas enterica]
MLVTMSVQLIAVRLLYQGLGVVDYGLYNLVAGLIALFSFMNVAMAAATQRFLSYENGHDNAALLKETFYQSVVLHTAIGLVVLLLLPIGGGYYITHFIHAPADRLLPACLLLVAISCSTFVNIITVPYEAVMNAHEDLGVVALLNICDSLLKLFTALYVCYWASGDRLITFGVLTMASLILILVLKRLYALRHYPEAHFRWHRVAWNDLRPMASFGAWNFIGAGCSIGRYQGTALILNYFFGIAINAAYGIAQQVNGLLLFLANTIVRAIRPQIVKSEGAGNRQRMLRLSETTCRVTALMVALIAIPFFIEMEY